MRKVNFKTLQGSVFTLECNPDTPIEELRPQLTEKSGIAVDRQRLLYKAQVLEDGKLLSDFVKEDDQTVHLVERPAGVGGPQQAPNPIMAGMRMPGGPGGPPPGFPFPIPGGGFGGPPGAGGQGGPPGGIAGLLSGLMGPGGPGGAPGAPPNMSGLLRNIGNIVEQLEQPSQNAQAAPQRSAPAQPAPTSSQAQAQPSAGGQQVMQLPHQVLFRLGQICNHLSGPNASFPGPSMPQLNVERNLVVLLGSYMTNLILQLQRLMPFMSRAADLMQRESLMQSQAERDLTQDLVHDLGKAMEDISRATGSVAHFYRTLNIGESGNQATVQVAGNEPSFQALIDEVGSVQRRGGAAAPSQTAAAAQNAPPPLEEQKQATQSGPRRLDDMPNPLEALQTVVSPQDMVAIMMQNFAAANPLPRRAHAFVMDKKRDYGNNTRHAEHLGRTIQKKFTNAGCEGKIKNVEEQDPCEVAKELFVDFTADMFDQIISREAFDELEPFMEFMKPTCLKGILSFMDELSKCFNNGTDDALEWIRANIFEYYKAQGAASLPPHMANNPAMVEGLAKGKTGAAFNMVKQMYAKAMEEYPAGEDEEMKNEEEEVKAAEAPTSAAVENPLERFKLIMAKDKEVMQKAKYDQGASSRAYSATCSFTKDKTLPMSEAVGKENDYMKTRSKKLAEINAEPAVRDKIRRNLIINGGFPQAKVEEKLGTIDEIPKEIVQAYIQMQKAAVKFRLSQDDDYKRMQTEKYPNAPQNTQMYNNLKKM